MPAPDHLLGILAELGDGGTVEMAERVAQMVANAADARDAEASEDGPDPITRLRDSLREEGAPAPGPTGALMDSAARTIRELRAEISTIKAHFRVIEDVHGTLILCPMCHSAVVLDPDEIQPSPAPPVQAAPGPTNADIRAWCMANGVPVSARGAVQKSAREAYLAAHAGE